MSRRCLPVIQPRKLTTPPSPRNHFVNEAKALDDLEGIQGAWEGSLLRLLPLIVTGSEF